MRKITLYLFHLLCNYELIFDFAFQRVTVGNYLMCFSKVRKTDFLTHHGITINMTIANMLNEIYLLIPMSSLHYISNYLFKARKTTT